MSARLRIPVALIGLSFVSSAALADGLVIPGIGPNSYPYPRPGYRQAVFPPPQVGPLGLPRPATGVLPRPTYRQADNNFPPEGGRYGGGIVEYVMTGGRPEPISPQYAGAAYGAVPQYVGPPPAAAYAAPRRAALPHGGLPDYGPGSPTYLGPSAAGYGEPAPSYAAPAPSYGDPAAYASQQAYAAPVPQAPSTGLFGGSYDPVAADPGIVSRPMNPVYYRQMVAYSGRARAGTVVIDTPNKFLYLVQPGGRAIRYGIGVGRPGFAWSGVKTISRKAEWPDWTPPKEMLARRPDLPRHMVGGEANPLGARALYLGSSLYRIHGTNEPYTIGTNVSSGCIRMMNQDVVDLYSRVGVGTHVIVE